MLLIGIRIVSESEGGVFYRQVRVTRYGKKFWIHKFRTMVANADKIGTAVTVANDPRVTPTGAFLRKYRLDELPQLFDVLEGNIFFTTINTVLSIVFISRQIPKSFISSKLYLIFSVSTFSTYTLSVSSLFSPNSSASRIF